MNRKVLALLLTAMVALSLTACSKKDSAKQVDDTSTTVEKTTTTTDKATTTTEDEDETTTTKGGLAPKINLGGLGTASKAAPSSDEETCMEIAVLADPSLSLYDEIDLDAMPQADLEAFYKIYITCVGPEAIIDAFMENFAEGSGFDEATLACTRTILESLSGDQAVKLLAQDHEVTEAFTDTVVSECVAQ